MGSTKGKTIPMKKSDQKGRTVRKSRFSGRMLRFFGILFTLFYLFALWNWVFHGGIETGVLHMGTLEIKISSEGVFIREELSINAVREGILIPKVNQGQRVPNQHTIAILIDKGSKNILDNIESMEREIIRRSIEESPDNWEDDPVFREKVQNEADKLTALALAKNPGTISHIKTALERLLYQRNRGLFREQDERLYLQKEKQELEQLKESLNENAVSVISDYSGVIVWDTQTTDEKYRLDNIENLVQEDLVYPQKISNSSVIQSIGVDESFPVEKGQEFVRLINNEKSWYVCVVSNKEAEQLHLKDSLLLKVEGLDVDIPCEVESIQPLGEKTRVAISFNRMIEETIHLRHAKADLIIKSVRGLKVPHRSLTNQNRIDNTADIFIVRFNRTVVKRVRILEEQDSFVVIEADPEVNETDPVRIFDIYVVDPRNIEEGQLIE